MGSVDHFGGVDGGSSYNTANKPRKYALHKNQEKNILLKREILVRNHRGILIIEDKINVSQVVHIDTEFNK